MNRRYANLRFEALKSLAAPAALGAAVILLPKEASAAPVSISGLVVTAGGAEWQFKNSTDGNTVGSGLGLSEASLVGPPGRQDGYDGAFVMAVNGTLFQNPTGNVDLTGTTVTSGTVVMQGLTVSEQFYFDPATPTVRAVYSYTNPSASAITVTVGWSQNLGSDSTTQIVTTSSGDTTLDAADRWVITWDGSPTGDPVLSFVRYGPGATALPTLTATPGSGSPRDLFADHYSLTVPAGQTRRLMFFGQLSQNASVAEASAVTFNSTATLVSSGLLNGLTTQQESEIVNWNFGAPVGVAPVPGTFVLVLIGVLVGAMVMKFLRWPLPSR